MDWGRERERKRKQLTVWWNGMIIVSEWVKKKMKCKSSIMGIERRRWFACLFVCGLVGGCTCWTVRSLLKFFPLYQKYYSSMLSQHSFISGLNFFPIFGTFGTHIFKIPFPIIKRSFSFSIHMLFVMHLNKYLGERSPNAFFNVSKFESLVFTVTNPLWFNVWARTLPLNCI